MSKKTKDIVGDILSWIFLIIMLIFLAVSTKSVIKAQKSGEPNFVCGYRFIYLTSGSMEPTIKTNGMALAKRVTDLSEIKSGDIISFQTNQNDGTEVRATHRIVEIDDNGYVYTKGDNNSVIDAYPLTIDKIESKVCLIFNFTAWIVNKWQSGTTGKVLLISIVGAVFFGYIFIIEFLKKVKRQN